MLQCLFGGWLKHKPALVIIYLPNHAIREAHIAKPHYMKSNPDFVGDTLSAAPLQGWRVDVGIVAVSDNGTRKQPSAAGCSRPLGPNPWALGQEKLHQVAHDPGVGDQAGLGASPDSD